MWKDFKNFAFQGNVIDLAIAVIIGGAIGRIITSLVNDIIMPIVGLALGGISFAALALTYNATVITYGLFLQSVVDFLIIAFCIFLIVRTISRFKKAEAATPPDPSAEALLLIEIRDLLKKEK